MLEKIRKISIKGNSFFEDNIIEMFNDKEHYLFVYGNNGSGKSTISKAFGFIKNSYNDDFDSVELYDSDNNVISLSNIETDKIFVFNEDFVDNYVKIQPDGMSAIVMFGEQVKIEEQLEELAKYGIYIPKAITSEERGNQLYEELIKFGKQPRRTSEDQTEVNLYGRFQRHGREWLTDEQIKSLSEIGIALPVQKDEKKESEQFFNELIQLGHQTKKSNLEEISLYKKLMRRVQVY